MREFTHFNESGRARMVDVSKKSETEREAIASGKILVNRQTFELIVSGGIRKGDVLSTAQIAGIMGAKMTSNMIPMCHQILLSGVDISFGLDEKALVISIQAIVKCNGTTGVEMEALTAVSIAALTIYDMCKAVQKDMVISDICLLRKSGGKSGVFIRE